MDWKQNQDGSIYTHQGTYLLEAEKVDGEWVATVHGVSTHADWHDQDDAVEIARRAFLSLEMAQEWLEALEARHDANLALAEIEHDDAYLRWKRAG